MYKNLNCDLLSITGRQSEIIELALTYGFQGIDIDMVDLVKRCGRTSFESASRFLLSSKLTAASFTAPIDLDASDEAYATSLAQLNGVAEIAHRAGAMTATVQVPAATDRLPYPEYFDVIRKRIDEIAAVLGKEEIRLALSFSPQDASAEEKQFKFVGDAEGFVALVRAITTPNVGVVFDSWTWHLGGGTLESLQSMGLERVAVVALADCKEGVEAAAATIDDCLLPGSTNVINNEQYLRAFAEAEMALPVAARGMPIDGKAIRDAMISKAQDALNLCFEQAGLPAEARKPENFATNSSSYTE
ncbi:MAG: sugar phosphate isomerase/epimerase [Aureliella sp.]